MNYSKNLLQKKINYLPGQGILEALILILGLVFIFAVALPGISSKARILQIKNTREQNQEAASSEKPLCGEIITVPLSQGRAPFRVFLVATEKPGKYQIAGFKWDFTGDGAWDTETSKDPQNYVFESPGDYQLKMLVIDVKGNSTVCAQTIIVSP